MHTHHAAHSTPGLLLTLSSELPRSSALARKARVVAARLQHGASKRDLDAAATLLSQLLDASDALALYPEDGVLDPDFDA